MNIEQLQDIQDQFSDATGMAAIAIDANGNYITKGSNFTDFCMKYTRGSKEGLKRCIKCDNEGKGTYFCHAGLMDFSSDITINGEKVGAIIGGQVLPEQPDQEKFRSIARELGINEDTYISALNKVPVIPEKRIRASSKMLANVFNQLVNLQYLQNLNKTKVQVFDNELKAVLETIHNIKAKTHDLQKVATMENILAINASIEANRVGRVGAGFEVVAREIGDLSKSSSLVYEEIGDLVKKVEKSVDNMSNLESYLHE
jgi:ligand-binding sensor protein